MFTIGEFGRLGGVSVRTLRHYDEIGLLRPASVDPDTGYRGYLPAQLGQLNRIMALKELGLSLTQTRRLLDGITLDELHGMLILLRAQLEHELEANQNHLLGVEARIRSIAREGAMPAEAGPRLIFCEIDGATSRSAWRCRWRNRRICGSRAGSARCAGPGGWSTGPSAACSRPGAAPPRSEPASNLSTTSHRAP